MVDISGNRDAEALSLNPVSNSYFENGETTAFTEAKCAINKIQTIKPRPH